MRGLWGRQRQDDGAGFLDDSVDPAVLWLVTECLFRVLLSWADSSHSAVPHPPHPLRGKLAFAVACAFIREPRTGLGEKQSNMAVSGVLSDTVERV